MPTAGVIFAHPRLEASRIHRSLIDRLHVEPDVHLVDLYERYPNFDIDVAREQAELRTFDVIIFQHPVYWYSMPALLKQWMDLVLEFGWAYGPQGTALAGKVVTSVVSAGGSPEAYSPAGLHGHALVDLLRPVELTARLCNMVHVPPFTIHGSHQMSQAEVETVASDYVGFIASLKERVAHAR